jgi:signal transduction histidine kinase
MSGAEVVREFPADPMLLRSLFLFEGLPQLQLESLAANCVLADYTAGILFAEGDAAQHFFVLVDGELSVCKRAGERDVETGRTTHRGAYCGATAAFIEVPPDAYTFSVRTTAPTQVVRIGADFFGHFVRVHYPMAVHLLQGMIVDHEGVHQIIDQQHRIEAVGTLTAGLMHGLNNPVGAIARAASQLRTKHVGVGHRPVYGRLSAQSAAVYEMLRCEATAATSTPVRDSALQATDREEEIDGWLVEHKVGQRWDIAPVLAAAGLDVNWLRRAAVALDRVSASQEVPVVVAAVAESVETLLLIEELSGASAEVSALVASAQRYSQLDSGPLVVSDVHDLLDSTLTVLSAAMDGIAVRTDYAPGLPSLVCYAGELNQSWTNILDNAIDAIRAADPAQGEITVRTALVDESVIRVQFCDNGIGIAPEILDRVFLPFFTTKPVGDGVGMGLDLAWRTIVGRHGGTLSAYSAPGETRLTACLPIRGAEQVR